MSNCRDVHSEWGCVRGDARPYVTKKKKKKKKKEKTKNNKKILGKGQVYPLSPMEYPLPTHSSVTFSIGFELFTYPVSLSHPTD